MTTIGADLDPDGYVLHGPEIHQAIAATPSVTLYKSLAPGSYELRLDGLAANCSVAGLAAVSVTIAAGQLSNISFSVECHATTGSIVVLAPTKGRDFATATYLVAVDAEGVHRTGSATPYLAASIPGVPAGTYTVTFESQAANCRATGDNPQTATITTGRLEQDTVYLTVPVECSATTGDVDLEMRTTGESVDVDGYTVFRDGQEIIVTRCFPPDFYCLHRRQVPLRLGPDAGWFFSGVPPATYSYEIRDLAANCLVNGANPRSVPVVVGDTTEVVFNVVCSSVP